jgi:endoglucanase
LEAEERKQIPKLHKIWVDIGVGRREEALKKVSIGDAMVVDQGPERMGKNLFCARGLDDKGGCYAVLETVRRLSKEKTLKARVTAVATVQEEIGTRGAVASTYAVSPDVGVAVDLTHATDFPDGEANRYGEYKLGGGPVLTRGPNINPKVFERLKRCAEREKIAYQVEADPGPTGTDARAIQLSRAGVATGLISIPARYLHTPNEMVHLGDIENTIRLLMAFARSLVPSDDFRW